MSTELFQQQLNWLMTAVIILNLMAFVFGAWFGYELAKRGESC